MMVDWMETIPDRKWHGKSDRKKSRRVSHHRYKKLGRHMTRNGLGIVGQLRKRKGKECW